MNMTQVGEVNLQILMATAMIMLLAAFADLLDGAVARAMKAESAFGGYFDSLADAITFGVAPSVIVLKSLSIPQGTEFSFLLTTAAMVYSVSGVLRLVRFNVISLQAKTDPELKEASNRNFTGLPIPAGAACAVSANLLLASDEFRSAFTLSDEARTWILFFVMCITGYFMVSRWKFPSLKSLRIRVASFKIIFLTVLSAVLIFYGILHHFPVVFFLIAWGYVVVAWILSIFRVIAGRRTKTLEDFEPDQDEEVE
jgi:CDP-diacylglycerol--serine O-phosphatidyltransferase